MTYPTDGPRRPARLGPAVPGARSWGHHAALLFAFASGRPDDLFTEDPALQQAAEQADCLMRRSLRRHGLESYLATNEVAAYVAVTVAEAVIMATNAAVEVRDLDEADARVIRCAALGALQRILWHASHHTLDGDAAEPFGPSPSPDVLPDPDAEADPDVIPEAELG